MVAIYADGADLAQMKALAKNDRIAGFTTNPSLCRKAGVINYADFAAQVLDAIGNKPVSFEVFADDFKEMERQAKVLASWGSNIYVKIPVTNTLGEPTYDLIWRLVGHGIKVNVTAIFTAQQVRCSADALGGTGIISVFAGRIADTGADPCRMMRSARAKIKDTKLLWASAREVYNVVEAEECGCDIITLSPDLIAKLSGFGRNLTTYSLETVRQFHADAAGYVL
jgi:transaldolase